MSFKVEEVSDVNVAYILSSLIELKRVYRESKAVEDVENIDKLILFLEDKKLYAGGTIK